MSENELKLMIARYILLNVLPDSLVLQRDADNLQKKLDAFINCDDKEKLDDYYLELLEIKEVREIYSEFLHKAEKRKGGMYETDPPGPNIYKCPNEKCNYIWRRPSKSFPVKKCEKHNKELVPVGRV